MCTNMSHLGNEIIYTQKFTHYGLLCEEFDSMRISLRSVKYLNGIGLRIGTNLSRAVKKWYQYFAMRVNMASTLWMIYLLRILHDYATFSFYSKDH